jgi:hypothetical protein
LTTATIRLTVHQLSSLLRTVQPHLDPTTPHAAVRGLRLDYDGHHLHAVATDTVTLAAARHATGQAGSPWARTISPHYLHALDGWISGQDPAADITITVTGDGEVTFTGRRDHLTVVAEDRPYPDWRRTIRNALHHAAGDQPPYTRLSAQQLARWAQADPAPRFWQSAPDQPLVVIGAFFIGVQRPTRLHSAWEEPPTLTADRAAWADSLASPPPAAIDPAAAPEGDERAARRDDEISAHLEDLLRQVIRSTSDAFGAATKDTAALTAYSLAGVHAWMAFRLTAALRQADPGLLQATLTDLDQQLEDGAIGEFAWDAAASAGHDPEQWRTEYEQHLQVLAAKKATS